MNGKGVKQRILRQKQPFNIYMQKTQGPKPSISSPNVQQRFQSKTVLNKQNYQPNLPGKGVKKPIPENSFGAAKLSMRQSVDDLKLAANKQFSHEYHHDYYHQNKAVNSKKPMVPKFNFLSKSNNFERCNTERGIGNAFSKKHLKTEGPEQYYEDQGKENCIMIADCQLIKSQYESSDDSAQQKLSWAKSFQKQKISEKGNKHTLSREGFNYEKERQHDIAFVSNDVKNIKKYQLSREQQKLMKKQIVNNIIMSSKADVMRSCDYSRMAMDKAINCTNHINKRAKYRLNCAKSMYPQEENFYCSKCAVNLARQGFDVEQISKHQNKMFMSYKPSLMAMVQRNQLYNSVEIKKKHSVREEQFKNFEIKLQSLKYKITNKIKLFTQKSEEMVKMDKKIQLTIINYDLIIKILKKMKQEEINKEQDLRKQKALDINHKKHELKTILDNIKDTSYEINCYKNRLIALKNPDFSFTFHSYLEKIRTYEEYLNKLELTMDIATFDENLSSSQLDQQNLIQDIFNQMFKRLTEPKLQALNNPSKQSNKCKFGNKNNKNNVQGGQSGGSSMFFCYEEQQDKQSDQIRKPFRALFEENKMQEISNQQKITNIHHLNLNNSQNVKFLTSKLPEVQQIKYFKEQTYNPYSENQN